MSARSATGDPSPSSSAAPAAAAFRFEDLPPLDALIKEYLLWRGFTQCFRTFEAARHNDRLQFFNVPRIVDQLFSYTGAFDFASMQSLWNFLSARFFAHLDAHHQPTVRAFARALQRYYIVHCVASGSLQKAVEFFRQYGGELAKTSASNGSDWEEWFQLPFLHNPSQDPRFAPFFTIQWRDTLRTSLSNFLTLIFSNIPVPKLLAFNLQQIQLNQRESALQSNTARIAQLESELVQAREHVASLKRENGKLRHALWRGVGHTGGDTSGGGGKSVVDEGAVGSTKQPSSAAISSSSLEDDARMDGVQEDALSDGATTTHPPAASAATSVTGEGRSSELRKSRLSELKPDGKRLLRGVTTVEIFDGADGETKHSKKDSLATSHVSRVSSISAAELLFGSDDEDSIGFDGGHDHRDSNNSSGSSSGGGGGGGGGGGNSSSSRNNSKHNNNNNRHSGDGSSGKRAPESGSMSNDAAEHQDALNIVCSSPILGHSDSILCAKFSLGGSMFASGSKDATLRIWDVLHTKSLPSMPPSGRDGGGGLSGGGLLPSSTLAARGAACTSTVYCMGQVVCLDWVPFRGREHVLFGTSCRDIKLWDVRAQCFSVEFQSPVDLPIVTSVQHSEHASHLVAVTSISSQDLVNNRAPPLEPNKPPACLVQLWDIEHGRIVRDIVSSVAPVASTLSQCFAPQGNILYAGGDDGFIRVYDLKQPQAEVMKWRAHDGTGVANLMCKSRGQSKNNGTGPPNALGSNMLVSIGADDCNILEWDLRQSSEPKINRRYAGSRRAPHPGVYCIDSVFDPTGSFLLTASNDCSALLYKTMRKSPVQRLGGHSGAVVAVDWVAQQHRQQQQQQQQHHHHHPHPHFRDAGTASSFILTGSLDGSLRVREVLGRR
jgi:WD40 repeat protein